MASPAWALDESAIGSVADPFAGLEIDAKSQTGTDWFALCLSAAVGNRAVHGVTIAATCETLAKTDERFAKKHAVGRIEYRHVVKNVPQPGTAWDEQVLMGKAFHGTRTTNKARMLFDTGEWEPSIRTRAKNAAIVGALLVNTGMAIGEATSVVSAIAGEPVPTEAIVNAETPLSILKREASTVSKENHVVYSRCNAQQAISWADHQLHADKLPLTAAVDWARNTTIARYIGEANCRYDPKFREYAAAYGVPYALVRNAWASVSLGDYAVNAKSFDKIPVNLSDRTPGTALIDAYSDHQQNLYDAIHRMANELESGVRDATVEMLLKVAEGVMRRKETKVRFVATGNEVLAETTRHLFGADEAAKTVSDSATSWRALVSACVDMTKGNRPLLRAFQEVHRCTRERQEMPNGIELIYVELAKSAVWMRAQAHLVNLLGSHATAHDRMSTLRRSVLGNSAELHTNQTVSKRLRDAMQPKVIQLAKEVSVGKVPQLAIPVAGDFNTRGSGSQVNKQFIANVVAHMTKSKAAWSERYAKLSQVHGTGTAKEDKEKAVKFGTLSKAFSMLDNLTIQEPDDGFIDRDDINRSYVIQTAISYVRKRHMKPLSWAKYKSKSAMQQAEMLDEELSADIPWVEVVDFCTSKLNEFHMDLVNGIPQMPESQDDNAVTFSIDDVDSLGGSDIFTPETEDDDLADFITEMMVPPDTTQATARLVLNTYESEAQANEHARANGYIDFYEAYDVLGEKARLDYDTEYTEKAMVAAAKAANERLLNPDHYSESLRM